MERCIFVEIAGKQYPMSFSLGATKKIIGKFGSTQNMMKKLKKVQKPDNPENPGEAKPDNPENPGEAKPDNPENSGEAKPDNPENQEEKNMELSERDSLEALETISFILEVLIAQGCAYKNYFEKDLPAPVNAPIEDGKWIPLPKEALDIAIQIADTKKIVEKISECVNQGSKKKIEAKAAGKNPKAAQG